MTEATTDTVLQEAEPSPQGQPPAKLPDLVRSRWQALAMAGAVLAAFAFCYADVFKTLWIQWNTNEANSHGLLIPWIAAYLLWIRRDRLLALRPAPVWWAGLPLLVGSLGVLLIGRLVGIVGLQEVSMVGTLWGLSLALLGWRGLHALWFPIGYLLFMMPIWDLATEPMYYPLQLFAARGAEWILSAFGIPVFREGTVLQLPSLSVEVALACSGINFLMSLLAIGIVLAYVMTSHNGRRLLIAVSAAILALLANPVRVALIVYSFHSGLASPRQSHMWQGMVVSLAAFAALFAVTRVLVDPQGHRADRPRAPSLSTPLPLRRVVGLTASTCALLALCGFARPLEWTTGSLASLHLETLPLVIGEWRADANYRPSNPPTGVVLADELWREYQHPTGRRVRVYVGRFVHNPGDGRRLRYWSDEFRQVMGGGAPSRLPGTSALNVAVAGTGSEAIPAVYWYQLGGEETTSRVLAKLYSAWGAITTGPGSLAVVVFRVGGDTVSSSQTELRAFAEQLRSAVRAHR